MTGTEIYKSALSLLGESFSQNDVVPQNTVENINRICADLKGVEGISECEDTVFAPTKTVTAIIYGLAALLSVSRQNAAAYNLFSEIYEERRKEINSSSSKIQDVMPEVVC